MQKEVVAWPQRIITKGIDNSPTKDNQVREQGKGDRRLGSKGREGHFPSGCPYWAGQGGEQGNYRLNTNTNSGQNEMYEQITSPMDRGKTKEVVGGGAPIDRIGIGNQGEEIESGSGMGRGHQILEGLEGTENTRDQGISGSQRHSGGSSAGQKMKRLARAGMGKGDAAPKGPSSGNGLTDKITRSYADLLKGESEGEEKEGNPDNDSEMGVENQLNATLEGEVVRCEFEEDHYEGVVNCFRDSTILVHFLGRPPNEVELRRWLQEIWSGKGWYIDRVRYLGKGYYAVVFDENVRIRDVLKEGPWYFRGGLVLVQPWEPEFSVDHGSYGRHPAWVELCNLPVHLWQFARSFFETIGTVISFDERQTFTFRPHARACVLVDTNKELPKKLEIKTGGRVMYEIKILVLGLPNACFRCKQSGHFIRNCPYKVSGERKSGGSNEDMKARGETINGKEKEVVVEMEGIEEEGTERENQGEAKIRRREEAEQRKEIRSAEGGVEDREGEASGMQRKISEDNERKKGKGLEKENIPPVNKNLVSPKGKERSRKGKERERESEEDMSAALIPYSSPPPPTIGDFLMEALEAREDEQAHEFQVVRRKSKRFPLTTGTREEPRTKGKVQRLCLEWDAKDSR